MSVLPIRRANTSELVATALREMIVDGRLGAGERINEVRMAQELGVSRTPLREALSMLAAEAALINTPSLGYSVRPLSLEEFKQLYEIRPILDPEALRLAGVPSDESLARLARINAKLARERDPEIAIALDDEWHGELLAQCPNRVLLELIEGIARRTRRYELALMRETRNVLRSSEEHELILDALRAKNLKAACAALKRNMQTGGAAISEWLKCRGA